MLNAADIRRSDETAVGSHFVANYPPFSVWSADAIDRHAIPAIAAPARADVPLGVYLHVPFCRRRCHFCYFRVYTGRNHEEVNRYLDWLVHEWELYVRQSIVADRAVRFVYFGGGTPSFLSVKQLESLSRRLGGVKPWAHDAHEITFECEPGTLTENKLACIRAMGVTRLSLGIENFDDGILERNGRAHRSAEIGQAYHLARSLGFPQINIDLIAGMLGETDENWQTCIVKTLNLEPDSITIYQMELPFNTTISRDILNRNGQFAELVASWPTKRRWVDEAFAAFERAGYVVVSGYTAVKDPRRTSFVYRDKLWEGADLVGLGVASFGHVNGVHVQNLDAWDSYGAAVERGHLPLGRAYHPDADERLIREFILQLKRGAVEPPYFREKYGVDVLERFRPQLASLEQSGFLTARTSRRIALSREGLLSVDALLHRFFLHQHRELRYT
jgi:oxygen-independent coproporphyrinogen-3 oxidase